MKLKDVVIGKRYAVASRKAYHFGQVVTAIERPEGKSKDFLYVKDENGKILRMCLGMDKHFNAVIDGIRPATFHDELRTLSNEELDLFLERVADGYDRKDALLSVKGLTDDSLLSSDEPKKNIWREEASGRKKCPVCGSFVPYEAEPDNPDKVISWDSNFCRMCGTRVHTID